MSRLKKKMAVSISSFLILTFITGMFTFKTYAADAVKIKFVSESDQIDAGEEFKISVVLQENPGIVSLRILYEYDDSQLELVSVQDEAILAGYVEAKPGYLVWVDGLATEDNVKAGTIATLTMRAKATVSGTAEIKVSAVDNCFNQALDDVAVGNYEGTEIKIVGNAQEENGTSKTISSASGKNNKATTGSDDNVEDDDKADSKNSGKEKTTDAELEDKEYSLINDKGETSATDKETDMKEGSVLEQKTDSRLIEAILYIAVVLAIGVVIGLVFTKKKGKKK